MSDRALLDLGAAELVELYRRRDASPVEVVEASLDAIAELDPSINSVITIAADEARAKARRVEADLARGADLGPLAGVPYGVKDVFDSAGIRTTGGSAAFAERVPERDSHVVAAMDAAGAILTAKLNTMELNVGDAWNPRFGPVRNPWNLDYYPGGTSAGPAAAVAARLLPIAIGADTGGSVRIPAANSGVVGLRPTIGRVSRSGMMPATWSFDQAGPMARTVDDAGLVLSVIAGRDDRDPATLAAPAAEVLEPAGEIGAVRVGVATGWFQEGVDSTVMRRVEEALDVLRGLGCEVREVELPLFRLTTPVAWCILMTEFTSLQQDMGGELELYGPATASMARGGAAWSAVDYVRAQRIRHLMQRECESAFEEVDVIVTPTTPSEAGRLVEGDVLVDIDGETKTWVETAVNFTQSFSLAGLPAISVPCGFGAHDMPVGLQIAGPPRRESIVLAVGRAFEQATEHAARRPDLQAGSA